MTSYVHFMLGVIVALYAVAALFFIKFWRKTADRLFLGFAIAFTVEGLNRAGMMFLDNAAGGSALTYAVRIAAFAIILTAIVDKNISTQSTHRTN